eukprot:Clim_evm25s247 gene=Clim_evmTU25s247
MSNAAKADYDNVDQTRQNQVSGSRQQKGEGGAMRAGRTSYDGSVEFAAPEHAEMQVPLVMRWMEWKLDNGSSLPRIGPAEGLVQCTSSLRIFERFEDTILFSSIKKVCNEPHTGRFSNHSGLNSLWSVLHESFVAENPSWEDVSGKYVTSLRERLDDIAQRVQMGADEQSLDSSMAVAKSDVHDMVLQGTLHHTFADALPAFGEDGAQDQQVPEEVLQVHLRRVLGVIIAELFGPFAIRWRTGYEGQCTGLHATHSMDLQLACLMAYSRIGRSMGIDAGEIVRGPIMDAKTYPWIGGMARHGIVCTVEEDSGDGSLNVFNFDYNVQILEAVRVVQSQWCKDEIDLTSVFFDDREKHIAQVDMIQVLLAKEITDTETRDAWIQSQMDGLLHVARIFAMLADEESLARDTDSWQRYARGSLPALDFMKSNRSLPSSRSNSQSSLLLRSGRQLSSGSLNTLITSPRPLAGLTLGPHDSNVPNASGDDDGEMSHPGTPLDNEGGPAPFQSVDSSDSGTPRTGRSGIVNQQRLKSVSSVPGLTRLPDRVDSIATAPATELRQTEPVREGQANESVLRSSGHKRTVSGGSIGSMAMSTGSMKSKRMSEVYPQPRTRFNRTRSPTSRGTALSAGVSDATSPGIGEPLTLRNTGSNTSLGSKGYRKSIDPIREDFDDGRLTRGSNSLEHIRTGLTLNRNASSGSHRYKQMTPVAQPKIISRPPQSVPYKKWIPSVKIVLRQKAGALVKTWAKRAIVLAPGRLILCDPALEKNAIDILKRDEDLAHLKSKSGVDYVIQFKDISNLSIIDRADSSQADEIVSVYTGGVKPVIMLRPTGTATAKQIVEEIATGCGLEIVCGSGPEEVVWSYSSSGNAPRNGEIRKSEELRASVDTTSSPAGTGPIEALVGFKVDKEKGRKRRSRMSMMSHNSVMDTPDGESPRILFGDDDLLNEDASVPRTSDGDPSKTDVDPSKNDADSSENVQSVSHALVPKRVLTQSQSRRLAEVLKWGANPNARYRGKHPLTGHGHWPMIAEALRGVDTTGPRVGKNESVDDAIKSLSQRMSGNEAAVNLLIRAGVNMACLLRRHIAKTVGVQTIINIFLSCPEFGNVVGDDMEGLTVMHYIAAYGSVSQLRQALADPQFEVNRPMGPLRETPLLMAIRIKRQEHVMEMLRSKRMDVNVVDQKGNMALHVATRHNDLPLVKELETLGANLNSAGEDGDTPILTAIRMHHADIAKYLLMCGCDVNYVNSQGDQVLHVALRALHRLQREAIQDHHFDGFSELATDCGIDSKEQSSGNRKISGSKTGQSNAVALIPQYEHMILIMLNREASLHTSDGCGREETALIIELRRLGFLSGVGQALLAAQAAEDIPSARSETSGVRDSQGSQDDNSEYSPRLSLFKDIGGDIVGGEDGFMSMILMRMVEYDMSESNKAVNTADLLGTTPLIVAAQERNLRGMMLLLRGGADLTAHNDDGDTPLLALLRSLAGFTSFGSVQRLSGTIGDVPVRRTVAGDMSIASLSLRPSFLRGSLGSFAPDATSALQGVSAHARHRLQEQQEALNTVFEEILNDPGLNQALQQQQNVTGERIVHLMARQGMAELTMKVLDRYPDQVIARTENGAYPIHYASRGLQPEMVTILLDQAPMTVDARTTTSGNTPLHEVVIGLHAVIAYLDPDQSMDESNSKQRTTAGPPSGDSGNSGSVPCALDDSEIKTVRDFAFTRAAQCVNMLVRGDAYEHQWNFSGMSPMHTCLSLAGAEELLNTLKAAESGDVFDINQRTLQSLTPLMLVTKDDNVTALKLLLSWGAQTECMSTSDRRNVLHHAMLNDATDCATEMVTKHPNLKNLWQRKDAWGNYPADLADEGNEALCDLIKSMKLPTKGSIITA